jgi:hypothetical protein
MAVRRYRWAAAGESTGTPNWHVGLVGLAAARAHQPVRPLSGWQELAVPTIRHGKPAAILVADRVAPGQQLNSMAAQLEAHSACVRKLTTSQHCSACSTNSLGASLSSGPTCHDSAHPTSQTVRLRLPDILDTRPAAWTEAAASPRVEVHVGYAAQDPRHPSRSPQRRRESDATGLFSCRIEEHHVDPW